MTVIFLSLFILSLTTMCLSLATMGWMSTHGRKNGCRWPTSSGLTSNNKTWNSRIHHGRSHYKIIEEIYMFGHFTPIYKALGGRSKTYFFSHFLLKSRQLELRNFISSLKIQDLWNQGHSACLLNLGTSTVSAYNFGPLKADGFTLRIFSRRNWLMKEGEKWIKGVLWIRHWATIFV